MAIDGHRQLIHKFKGPKFFVVSHVRDTTSSGLKSPA